jgi:hypothetical protein
MLTLFLTKEPKIYDGEKKKKTGFLTNVAVKIGYLHVKT